MQEIADYKEISINNLPNCYAKECLLKIVTDPEATVNVVAVTGYAKDWSAYIGFPHIDFIKDKSKNNYEYYCSQVRNPYGVASNGDKIEEKTARQLFPQFKKLNYRR